MDDKIRQFFDKVAKDYKEDHNFQLVNKLIDEVGVQKGEDVLDLACGKGVISTLLYQRTKKQIIAMDLSKEMISLAKRKNIDEHEVLFLNQDFLLTDSERKFDSIILFDAYPHFLDRQKLKEKVILTLKPEGKFAILFDLSRAALLECHKGKEEISRELEPAKQEALFFLDTFDVLSCHEDEKSYVLILKKKR